MPPKLTLVCFAVKQEAAPFERWRKTRQGVSSLVTGMGPRNAVERLQLAVGQERPELVLSAGFAGGLNPQLSPGTVLFASDGNAQVESALKVSGARPGSFHCAERVAVTAQEKQKLYESTGADAVEMESQAILDLCARERIPAATVRVILDPADQDLPMDFNHVMTNELQMDPWEFAIQLVCAPRLIPKLLKFQKEARTAAEALSGVLIKVLNQLHDRLPDSGPR